MRALFTCLLATAFTACAPRSTRASRRDAALVEAAAIDASTRDAAAGSIAAVDASPTRRTPRDFAPVWTLAHADAPGRLDPSDRLRLSDGAGGTVLPGDPDPVARPAPNGTPLFAGDRIEAGASGLTLRDAREHSIALGDGAHAVVPSFGGSDLVLTVGSLEITNDASEPLVVDTPALRLRVPHDARIRCTVSDDGHTACAAIAGRVAAWPSPRAPASTLGGRVHPHARSRPGHPISLDVDVHELTASARPLPGLELAPSRVISFGPDGAESSERPASSSESAFATWRGRLDHRLSGPTAHLYPVSQLARAGTGDLADARALIVSRDEFGLSAAIARATARAERGRALALRGGDVTALVPMAHLDEVVALARSIVPTRATMLDTGERQHVP